MKSDYEKFAEVLYLDPDTGILYWNKKIGTRCRVGEPAGCIADNDYLVIQVFGTPYKAHRIVWLLFTGNWPEQEIDHINRNKSDNRPCNLRDVSHGVNRLNSPYPSHLTRSGVRGVYPQKSGKWQAQLCGRVLGTFDSKAEAVDCRRKAFENV